MILTLLTACVDRWDIRVLIDNQWMAVSDCRLKYNILRALLSSLCVQIQEPIGTKTEL